MHISIIVPCYNGTPFIEKFISSLSALEVPENLDLEVLIIDNGSTDGSWQMLQKQCNGFRKFRIKLLEYFKKQSSYAVRNYGVSQSKGNMLAFTDIDCVLPGNYLLQLHTKLSEHTTPFIVAGNVELFLSASPSLYEYYDYVFGFNMKSYVKEWTGVTANAALPASTFQASGGFDEVESGGDRAFFKRLVTNHKVNYHYHEELLVYHPCRDSYIALLRKAKRVARGHATYYQKQPWISRIKRSGSLVLSALVQLHQFKVIRQKKDVLATLSIPNRIFLIGLIFWIGFYTRIYTVRKTLFENPASI